jgi:hypothetical protein
VEASDAGHRRRRSPEEENRAREIARLEADIGRKQATRSVADQFFKK